MQQMQARKTYLSMGAGVNTAAALLKYHDQYEAVLFADTGNEVAETYQYIEQYLKPFCITKNIDWHTVRNGKWSSLYAYCWETKHVPDMRMRWCTNDFKIRPIQNMLRSLGHSYRNPANVHIGYAYDEAKKRMGPNAYVDDPKYVHRVYPLVEDRITRIGCEDIIKAHEWPLPEKSGCDFCMFKGYKELRALSYRNPQRFAELIALEEHTGLTIIPDKPLKQLSQNFDAFDKMTPEEEEIAAMCDSGYCHT